MVTTWSLSICMSSHDHDNYSLEKVWIGELNEDEVNKYTDFVKTVNQHHDDRTLFTKKFIDDNKSIINEFTEDTSFCDSLDRHINDGDECGVWIDSAILSEIISMRDLIV